MQKNSSSNTNSELMAKVTDEPEWCLDLIFMQMFSMLGYEFEDTTEVAVGKKFEGQSWVGV